MNVTVYLGIPSSCFHAAAICISACNDPRNFPLSYGFQVSLELRPTLLACFTITYQWVISEESELMRFWLSSLNGDDTALECKFRFWEARALAFALKLVLWWLPAPAVWSWLSYYIKWRLWGNSAAIWLRRGGFSEWQAPDRSLISPYDVILFLVKVVDI